MNLPKTVYLAFRDSKGRMHTINPNAIPADADPEIQAAAWQMRMALAELQPKRGRGRPKGYQVSPESLARSVAGRAETLARKRAAMVAN
jgi:hypothetical protein